MEKNNKKLSSGFIVYLFILTAFIVLTYFIIKSPLITIISSSGFNSYLIAFTVALIGGLCTFVTIPYYLIVAALAVSGLSPVNLGIAAGVGLMIGDSTSYFLGYKGRSIVPGKMNQSLSRLANWLLKSPLWLTYIVLFMYGAFSPFPNDFLVIPLGTARYPYWRLFIPLGLGSIVFNILVATLGHYSWQYFVG